MQRVLVYLLFLLSGATALVYEVAWTRRLVLVLGGTTVAVSLILAAWMLGLALGARIFGKMADRARRPLLLYGLLEAGIAGLALLFPLLLDLASGLALAVGGGKPVSFILCFVVVLLPTTLMGGTLPVLARFIVTSLKGLGGRIGVLYGVNTLGAVFGTFLSGFVLIEALGVYGSTFAAAAVNVGVAAMAIALARKAVDGPAVAEEETSAIGPARIALVAAFAAGFLSLGAEVLWTRMLTFFLEGFTWTFSAMLTTFLAGLALGALLSGRIVNRVTRLRGYVACLFLASGVVAGLVLFALTENYEITKWAKSLTSSFATDMRQHHAASLFVVSFLILFPPALVMGGIFPAIVKLATRSVGEVGTRVGAVYSVNTIGAVVGSLAAGLVLIPAIGMAWAAGLFAFLSAGTGLALLGRRAWFGLPAVAATVVIVLLAGPGTPFVLHSQVFQETRGFERELVSYEEGPFAAVSVVKERRNDIRAVFTDEFQAAATGPHYKYMRLLAHLPLLISPKWEGAEVLVICFGTGTTAGSAAQHPLGRLDLVEISQEVLDQAPYFEDVNRGVLDPAKKPAFPLGVHVDDGRNVLVRADRKWDVISLEPLMPYTPGAVNLYTEDFYRLCRERLTEDGVMCQWVPFHAIRGEDYRMLLRSFTNVFPQSTLWFVEETSLIIGTMKKEPIDYGRLLTRMRHQGVLDDLRAIEFDDPLLVLNTFVAGSEELAVFTADAETMTDEHPYLEFRPVPYGWPNTFAADNLAWLMKMRKPVTELLDLSAVGEADRERIRKALARYYEGGQAFIEAQYFTSVAAYRGARQERKEQSRYRRLALEAFEKAVKLNPADASARYLRKNAIYGWRISVGLVHYDRGQFEQAAAEFADAAVLQNAFKPDLAWMWLGRTMNRMKQPVDALEALEKALGLFPVSPDALAERGYAKYLLEDFRGAAEDFNAAFGKAVPPEADKAVLGARKRVLNMEAKGLFPEKKDRVGEAAKLIEVLKETKATEREKQTALEALRAIHRLDEAAVHKVLADEEQMLALKVFAELGDIEGTIGLLKTGDPKVRARAADLLSFTKKPKVVVPALLDAMEDPDREVREAAMTSYFGVTGEKPGDYDPDAPEAERKTEVDKLRADWR